MFSSFNHMSQATFTCRVIHTMPKPSKCYFRFSSVIILFTLSQRLQVVVRGLLELLDTELPKSLDEFRVFRLFRFCSSLNISTVPQHLHHQLAEIASRRV